MRYSDLINKRDQEKINNYTAGFGQLGIFNEVKPMLPRAPNAAELATITQQLKNSQDPVKHLEDIINQLKDETNRAENLRQQLEKLKGDYEKANAQAFAPTSDITQVRTDPRNPKNWIGRTSSGGPTGGGPVTRGK